MQDLSHGQAALWFVSRMAPGSAAYHLAAAARVVLPADTCLRSHLDIERLRRTFQGLAERHPELRATFAATAAGTPVRRIHERLDPEFLTADATGWSAREIADRLAAEAARPFDLEQGPLLRTVVLTGAGAPLLLIVLHHLVADFWSLGIIARDLGAFYDGEPLPPLRAGYEEHVRREQERIAGPRGERLWAYWSERLRDAPDLDLPADHPRPAHPFHRGGTVSFEVSPELTGQLRDLARDRGATLFATLLAGFQALLARTAGQTDFVVGAPSAGRSGADLASTVGYFVHPLALRADLSGEPTGAELVDRARRTVREGLAHQALPFALLAERLRPVRVPGRSPLFQAMLVFHQARHPGEEPFPAFVLGRPGAVLRLGKTLALDPIPLPSRDVPFDLTLILAEEADGGLTATLEFSADLFDPTTARRMAERFSRLLAAMAADPARPVDDLPLLDATERHQLLCEWNDTAVPEAQDRPVGVYERFAAQAERTPRQVAVVHGTERVTYEELHHRARALAAQLRRMGVGPEKVVGVSQERGVGLVASLLGVLAAGGAYLPLDPGLPRERLSWMVEDAGAAVVVGGKDLNDVKDPKDLNDMDFSSFESFGSFRSFGSLAYILYTSGSTGRPKGVAVTHGSVAALLDWAALTYSREELTGVFAATSIGFDISVFELFAPLSAGGTVILGENVLALHGLPAAGEVTLINTVPSAMAELLRHGPLPRSVRTVNLAGEPLPAALVRRVRESTGARVLNLYGPTEDTVYSTGAAVDGAVPPPIGRPLPGTRAHLLDPFLRPTPIGAPGELWLAGAGLARGYLHRPELTAERFLPDPFGPPGSRLYRTGDRARLRPDGLIEHLGRVDHQVKVRGVRIELGEVEAALLRQPAVREAAVDVREIGGHRILVAWFAGAGGEGLRAALAASLPSAMIPSLWVELPALPRLPSGKVDRRSLPAPELGGTGRSHTPPRDPVEEALAAIWREVLEIETVGVEDNFFDLGGHSLLAMRLLARIRHVLGVDLPVQTLFERPTIAALARVAVAVPPRPVPPLRPVPRDGDLPLSWAQERLWFLDRLSPGSAVYNMPGAFRLRGPLHLGALARAFSELARRHEVLRTRFVEAEGRPVQAIDPAAPVPLPSIDLSGLADEAREGEARRIAGEEARRPFDLQRGPVLRTRLVRLAEEEHLLLVTAHHIAADGWSMGLMAREVAEILRSAALPELPIQYADFASWQRGWMSDDVLEVQLAAWRERLAGAPARLDLPTDRPRPAVQSLDGGRNPLALPPDLGEALHALGRSLGVSPYMVLVASFLTLLGRLSGSEDLLLGTPVANRRRIETEPLIGLFVNTLVLRGDLTDDPPFAGLLERVRETALAAYLHQDLPFEKLVEELAPERSLAWAPLVQVLLVFQNAAPESLELPGLEVEPVAVHTGTSKLDLTLELAEDVEDGLVGSIEYRRDLFDAATIDHLGAGFAALLAAAVDAPELRLSELPLLTWTEQWQLLLRESPERLVPRETREPRGGAPRTATEEVLAGLWAELLGRSGWRLDDDFFAWGGHSLLGTRLVARLRQTFGVEISLRTLFEAPTLSGLAARLDAALGRPELPPLPPIEPALRSGPLPLSFAQQRLWLLDRLEPGGSAYNIPLAVRLGGPLDVASLESALAAVIDRHEALRTRFVEMDGEPVQDVHPRGRSPVLSAIDLTALPVEVRDGELRRRLGEEAEQPFDLAAGPLLRARVFGLDGTSVFFVSLHHIVSDGWSIGVLVRELSALVRGEALPPLPVQFGDCAVWQRQWLQGEVLEEQLAWWRERLAGLPALELPTDRPRPARATGRGRQIPLALPDGLWTRLGATARRLGCSPFMALAAGLQVLLARWSGQTGFAIGFPVANRRRPETEGLIGLFVNTLVLRADLSGDPPAAELLARTRDAALGAYAHQDLPFEKLVEELNPERNLGRSPIFQVLLALDAPLPALELNGQAAEPLDLHTRTAKFDLSWLWRENGSELVGALEHASDLFDTTTVQRMAGHLKRLLAGLADQPELRISDLPLLSDAESAQLGSEWNDTGEVPAATLPELIGRQVEETPERIALVVGNERLTYRELDRRAGHLADHLRRRGVAPEVRVAVCRERSAELLVALLAVWRAGGAYVPLDPTWTQERLAWMLEDSGATVVVEGKDIKDVKDLKDENHTSASSFESFTSFGSFGSFQSLAYLIYTSGSTGRPKGVAIEHGSAAALALWAREVFSPAEMAGVLASTSVCFDLSIFELFVPLTLGGTVILAENALALPGLPSAEAVTLVNTVPSAMGELVRAGSLPASVRTVCLAGEALRRDLVDRLQARPGLRVLNLYGPSEDTTYSTWAVMEPGDRRPPSIGRPLAGTRVRLLDAAGRQVPPGAAGELCLGGGGLARGYLGRPELTAEKFVPDPLSPGARLYRTGDLARARTDGTLDFLGRIDHQVKVRGFRIEPGEIEAALLRYPAVHDAAVVVRETDAGDRLLAAWLTVDGEPPAPGELREWLLACLPEPYVPGLFAVLDALPLTPNGKVDRLALARRPLPLPGHREAAVEAPQTPLEGALAALWAEILGVERVGVDDDFFALGGHSLLAARLVARLREALEVDLPLRAVFEEPTVARLARRVETAHRAVSEPPLVHRPRGDNPPLSFAQERLWFLDRLEGGASLNMAAGVRLTGALDVSALAGALAEVERRHEVLRTRFPEVDGRPQPSVAPAGLRNLPLVDLPVGETERLREVFVLAPFDLAAGPPWRAVLLRSGPREHELVIVFHHIVTDGWSIGLFTREVAALYAGTSHPEPPIQYADFALWQRSPANREVFGAQLAFWRERLAGDLPAEPLTPNRPRTRTRRSRAVTVPRLVSPQVADALRGLGRAEGASLYMVLLAALGVLLGRHGGSREAVLGSPVAGRTRPETEGVIGCFLNTIVLRLSLEKVPFRRLLAHARDAVLEALAHQDIPFERVLEEVRPERELARTPLFQVLLNMLNFPRVEARLPGLALELEPGPTVPPRFDLTVYAEEEGDALRLRWVWDAELFEPERREEIADQLDLLLAQIARAPDTEIDALSLVTPRAAERLPDPAAGIAAAWHGSVQGRFILQALRRPEAVAVLDREGTWTYGELLRGSRRIAQELQARGVQPGDVVAIQAHRSASLVRAVLGVLQAGAVFVILDRDDPEARRAAILEAARPKAILSTEAEFDPTDPSDDSSNLTHPDAPAWLAFTSGSTGTPKGIIGTQRPLAHFLDWHVRTFDLGETDRFSLLSGLSHDPLLRDLFTPLWLGATLIVPDPERMGSPGWLAQWMSREEVTVSHLTPAMGELLTGTAGEVRLPALRRAFFGGDALLRRDVARLRAVAPDVTCVNFYGATETPQAMSWHLVDPDEPDDGRPVPLGRGIEGVQLLVLTEAGRLAGLGEVGEIHVRTPYLALGYLDDEALTRERFLPGQLYRTGDLGCYLLDGQVRPLGRADRQIKIRGFRVEPAEIESVLARQEGVREALILLRGERLVAYVAGTQTSPAALRSALRDALPPYMVPSAIVLLGAFPLTPNGKVDRAALPDPEREDAGGYVAPRDPIEALLAEIWAGVLGLERVGAHDEFFALGGHSLLATQVVSRIREACGVDLPLRALFEAPTLDALARRIEEARRGGARPVPPLRRIPRGGELPLSFAQQRLWFLDQMEPGNPNLHLATALRLTGPLDASALAAALQEVVRRHETLRTTFGAREGRPWQAIAPEMEVALPVVDLGGLPEEACEKEARQLISTLAWQPFDLTQGPLIRAALLTYTPLPLAGEGPGVRVLLLTLHHIVSDGWSTGVLFDELTVLYEAFRTGRPSPLPPLPVQYVDFAAWQRSWLDGEILTEQLDSWRATLGTSGFPVLELPTDRPRPAIPSFRGARRPVLVPSGLAASLQDVGRRHGATLFMVLMTAFQTLLHRTTGQDELLVGSPVANRTRVEVERLIGMFFNLLAFRADLADDPPFAGLLARVREAALTAYLHQDLPFEKLLDELQPERQLSRTPLFQATLVLQNAPRVSIDLPGLTLTPLPIDSRSANFDLNLQLTEMSEGTEGIAGWLEYRTDLFDAPTIDRLAAHLLHLLEGVVADPGERLSRLPLLASGERFQLLAEWNDTRAPLPEGTLHGLFLAQAARTPEAVAVVSAERSLTYRELDEESARVAVHLRSRGVGPGVPVAVSLERTAGMIPILLGILRAGGFYVPLERAWPEARIASIVSTLSIEHVLTAPVSGSPGNVEEVRVPPDAFAYVIFTSGSTGVPKGVMVQHRPVVHLITWVNRTFGVGPGDRVLFVTSLAFDLSVYDVFGMLAAGGTVRIASDAEIHDPEALGRILCREPITFWDSAPAALAQVVPFLPMGGDRSRLRLTFLSGDWIPLPLPGAMRQAFPNVQVLALGGATEATVWSNSFAVGELAPCWVSIPYGRPIPNARYHVLDAGFEPQPIGVPGDLYIGGECLSSGYANDPALTASKYLPDPWGEGARLYRTGDRARFLADGNIEFLGRIDQQVKIRGFRIELGEIEAALLAHPAVREAVVTANGPRDEKRLVAYVVQDPACTGEDEAEEDAPDTQIDRWQVVYDEVYSRATVEPVDPTLNLAGWISSYTGEPLPEAEMRAWVEATVERILEQGGSRGLGRVLEIGCGTGMLLFRIAPRCRSYLATDLSDVALHGIRRQLAARGLDHVTLARQAADDWNGIAPGSFDAVILNSVTQHFPGVDYLRRVVEGAVRAVAPGGFVFVGDVRSFPLLTAFHASVQLAQAPDGLTRAQLARRVRQRAAQEEELLVDPRFFTDLGAGLPEVGRVGIQLKRGRDRNEMSRFRFDAVLHLCTAEPVDAAPVPWQSWTSLPRLREVLSTEQPASLGVLGIPDDRLREEAVLLAWLEGSDGPETAGDLRRALQPAASGLEPEDLWQLARDLGYAVEVRSAAEVGRCDALFWRVPPLPWERGPGGEGPGEAGPYANNPLQGVIARKLVPRLRAWLAERLPESMLPAAIVALDALPLTPNGKVDRKALPEPDSARPEMEDELVAPRTAAERQLAAVWRDVLGLDRVGIHDNFFGLGGDSILSIQVIARAQQAGLRLTPRQLFQHQTIAELAAVAQNTRETVGESVEDQGPVTGPVPLTPIQHWFFEQELEDPDHWNLAVLLELRELPEKIRPEHLDQVTAHLLEHHDALRLRFRREESGWVQHNDPPGAPAPCSTLDLSALPDGVWKAALESAAAELQKSLDLENGPLQRFGLFRRGAGEADRLLLTVHHLVIDGVSWRILLEDLQTGLRQLARGEELRFPPKTTSYRRWAEALAGHARSETVGREGAFWLGSTRRALPLPGPLPGDGRAGANLEGTARTVQVGLGPEETRTLLREVPEAFQTRIDDVLLTALVRAFSRWTGSRSLLLDLEGHGRGEILPDLDLSRTIGWFTAIYPVLLEVAGGDPLDDLKSIKEQLRAIPSGGAGYGLLRYGEWADQLARIPQPQVIFNDLGQLDSVAREDALIRPARESFGATRSPRARRRHLLEIYATVLEGRLELDLEFSTSFHREATIQRLAGWFLEELRELIDRCTRRSEGAGGFTPSDFPEADLDQEELDLLLEQLG